MPAFLLPDLGEGLTEAEIVTWHVKVGDTVKTDQPVVEVETAKAVVEVPVPFGGRVAELHAKPGDVVAVGSALVTVEAPAMAGEEDAGGEGETGDAARGGDAVSGGDSASGGDSDSGSVLVGYGTSRQHRRRRRAPGPGTLAAPAIGHTAIAVASPVVRRLAREAGVDLATLRGTGPNGLITRSDLDTVIRARSAEKSSTTEPMTAEPGITRVPLRGPRKAAADKLSRSRREIPEATVWVDADATELLAARAALNADEAAPRISLLALLARFAVLGLRRYPELNARVEGDEIVLSTPVHLGFAAQTGRGLLVPVVRDAHAQTLEQLAVALAEQTRRARAGELAPADMAGGTFTVNNYGVFGVDGSAAIINHPEVAILGIGRIIERPWVVGGAVVPRSLTQLTLAFDHRVCDGGTAGGFLRFIADCAESPASALRHL